MASLKQFFKILSFQFGGPLDIRVYRAKAIFAIILKLSLDLSNVSTIALIRNNEQRYQCLSTSQDSGSNSSSHEFFRGINWQ